MNDRQISLHGMNVPVSTCVCILIDASWLQPETNATTARQGGVYEELWIGNKRRGIRYRVCLYGGTVIPFVVFYVGCNSIRPHAVTVCVTFTLH